MTMVQDASPAPAQPRSTNRAQLKKQGGPALARVPAALLQFVAFALVARTAGEAAFGLLIFTQTGVRLTTAVALRGAGPIVLAAFAGQDPRSARLLLQRELRGSAPWLLPLWGVLVAVEMAAFGIAMSDAVGFAALSFAIVFAGAALRLLAEATKGLDAPIRAILGEFLPLPLVVFSLLGLGWLSSTGTSAPNLTILFALLGSQVVGCGFLVRHIASATATSDPGATTPPLASANAPRLHLSVSTVLTLALPLLALAITALVGDGQSVGRLGATLRIMSPAAILVSGIAAGVLPTLVKLANAQGSRQQRSALRMSWLLVAACSVPYSLILLALPSLIERVYGPEFADLATAMRIVAIGQLLNGLTGVAVEVLQVSGKAAMDSRTVSLAVPTALVASLAAWLLFDARPEICGAIFFASVLSIRSLVAGLHVYKPLLESS